MDDPRVKNDGINGGFKQADGQQNTAQQRSDDIRATFCPPIMHPKTAPPFPRITVRSWHVVGKTAFIQKHQRTALSLIFLQRGAKSRASFGIRFWVIECFFYKKHRGVSARIQRNF